jgi:hypothetical protein
MMSDNLDLASEFTELYNQDAIKSYRKPVGPQANGRCHWCDEIVSDEARFCDVSCRALYDRHVSKK